MFYANHNLKVTVNELKAYVENIIFYENHNKHALIKSLNTNFTVMKNLLWVY